MVRCGCRLWMIVMSCYSLSNDLSEVKSLLFAKGVAQYENIVSKLQTVSEDIEIIIKTFVPILTAEYVSRIEKIRVEFGNNR